MKLTDWTPLLQVFDTRKSCAFYVKLGFEVTGTYEPDGHLYWVELTRGEMRIMLNACYEDHERPDTPDPARVAAHRDTEIYFRCTDVDAAHAEFKSNGLDVSEPAEQHGRREVVLRDPDGFHLSFFQ